MSAFFKLCERSVHSYHGNSNVRMDINIRKGKTKLIYFSLLLLLFTIIKSQLNI